MQDQSQKALTEVGEKRLGLRKKNQELSKQLDVLNEQINDLDRKDKMLEDQLQIEYSYKKFMIDVRSVFPENQKQGRRKSLERKKTTDNVFVTEAQNELSPKNGDKKSEETPA